MNTAHIKVNDVISICHYSGLSPFKCIVLEAGSDFLIVNVTKDFAVKSFNEGDPVIFGIENMGEMMIYGGSISQVRAKDNIIHIEIDKPEPGSENRQVERYPVSMCADIRTKKDNKKQLAAIKDISYYGILIFTKVDIDEGETIEVDIYMEKSMIFLKAVVNRKRIKANYIEYGVGIKYEDGGTLNYMKDYTKRIKQDQIDSIRKAKK